MKMAQDGSNPMFKYESGLNNNGGKGDKIKTEELDEVVVYAPYKNRKKPNEVGGKNAASSTENPNAQNSKLKKVSQ